MTTPCRCAHARRLHTARVASDRPLTGPACPRPQVLDHAAVAQHEKNVQSSVAQGAAHSSGWAAGGLPSSPQRFGDVAEELLARSSPKRARLSPKTALYSLGVLQALVSAGASHSGQDSPGPGSRTRRKGAYASASAIDASSWHVSAITALRLVRVARGSLAVRRDPVRRRLLLLTTHLTVSKETPDQSIVHTLKYCTVTCWGRHTSVITRDTALPFGFAKCKCTLYPSPHHPLLNY